METLSIVLAGLYLFFSLGTLGVVYTLLRNRLPVQSAQAPNEMEVLSRMLDEAIEAARTKSPNTAWYEDRAQPTPEPQPEPYEMPHDVTQETTAIHHALMIPQRDRLTITNDMDATFHMRWPLFAVEVLLDIRDLLRAKR